MGQSKRNATHMCCGNKSFFWSDWPFSGRMPSLILRSSLCSVKLTRYKADPAHQLWQMIVIITNDGLVLRDALRGVNWDLSNYMWSFSYGSYVTCFLRSVLLDTHSEAMERFKCKLQSKIGSDVTEYVERVKQPGKYFLVPYSKWLSLCRATLSLNVWWRIGRNAFLISSLSIFPIESMTYFQPPEIIDFLLKIEWKGERERTLRRSLLSDSIFVCAIFRPPILRTFEDGRVYLHPKSVNAQVIVFEDNFLIYHEKMKSSSVGLAFLTKKKKLLFCF